MRSDPLKPTIRESKFFTLLRFGPTFSDCKNSKAAKLLTFLQFLLLGFQTPFGRRYH